MDLQLKDCNGKGERLVNSGLENNGIKGLTDRPAKIFPANTITIDFWGNSFYRNFPYKMATHNHVFSLSGKVIRNERVGVFLAMQLSYLRNKFSYDNMGTWEKIKEVSIWLPQTAKGNIAYGIIEIIIKKLEDSRLCELHNYLVGAGLNECSLTNSEQSAVRGFENLKWREFLMDDLFEKQKTKKLKHKAKELPKRPTSNFSLPCLTSSFMNQGLNYYAPRNGATILNNVISIPSNSDVYRAYYQPNDFTVLSDAYAIRWKDECFELQEKQYLFLVGCINKVTNLPIYSYKNKLGGWEVVKNKHILLPVNDKNQPDLETMEKIISALQKSAIADVTKYTEQNLDASRRVVALNTQNSRTNLELPMAAEPFKRCKWEGFDHSICDFFGSDKTILIGCYKGKKYEDWIRTHNIYTIRLGDTKGSMEANRELFDSTSLLVLYELGKPNNLSAYKIIGNQEMGKEELLAMDYPKKEPRKSYMTFSITPLEMDLTFLVEHHLVERLIELNSENAKGTPVFIQP
ncbi:MAG: restriction endonuclease subunit S [Bacteroidaceae bacterium]|nr:restriction endonuclease subunit S [Bacteroidaceae bacterium]